MFHGWSCPAEVPRVEENFTGIRWGLIILGIIALWKACKKVWCWARSRRTRTVGAQTTGMSYVAMALESGVPMLHCLWQAGYSFTLEEYPPGVQEEYY